MSYDKMLNIVFGMRFTVKQMNKSAASAEKASEKEKLQVKKALEKGNAEAARIYAQNAIRKKNEALNYLRLASRLDAAAGRIQTAIQLRNVTRSMEKTVSGMGKVLDTMDPVSIARVMDTFEKQMETLEASVGTMDAGFAGAEAGTVPVNEVDSLMEQIAVENNLDISERLASGGCGALQVDLPAEENKDEDDELFERLRRLRVGAV
ncbi:putative vesicular protein trafficking mediator [Trypanosoma vivax]|uniref:Putative vesicular protein trafficking mediator n=1 Tax=Trypanosoma vivax (strain Y486) TaxID=1055687 RepID=G0UAJ6_TRYVY|nr:putative vesicular protein trafficking mediator [Trypanosoma vivax]CCC52829.1 putative vesicular protein trafficking mediator [Trypanosoma vivax Y486]